MPKEKEYYREVVADVKEVTGKTVLGVYDIMKFLKVGHNKAIRYLGKNKTITVYQFAAQLI